MKCFYYFKEKARSKGHKSAPELRNPVSKSNSSAPSSGGDLTKSVGSEFIHRGISDLYEEKDPNLRVFTLSELRIATNDFNRKLKIGEGGFGSVYQGKIKNFDGQNEPTLVAIKKLSKDGFQVVGTFGYAAPDYIETGHLSSKSDVWSFGIVLYEILAGRRSLERGLPKPEQRLLDWAKQFPADSKRFSKIMDPRLEGQYSLSAARKIAKLADNCLVKNQKERPSMSEVVARLKQIIKATTDDGSGSNRSCSPAENEADELEKKGKQIGAADSARRRFAHLAKLGEQVEGVGKRRFLIMQRAKVS